MVVTISIGVISSIADSIDLCECGRMIRKLN
jgi:hypothetical protein